MDRSDRSLCGCLLSRLFAWMDQSALLEASKLTILVYTFAKDYRVASIGTSPLSRNTSSISNGLGDDYDGAGEHGQEEAEDGRRIRQIMTV